VHPPHDLTWPDSVAGVTAPSFARPPGALRVVTLNLFAHHGDWPARRDALRIGLQALDADLLALQEAVVDDGYDQVAELLGPEYTVVHQTVGLVGDGTHHGAAMATRLPVRAVHEVDLHLTPRTGNYSCATVIADIVAPEPFGRLLMACHGASWPWWAERERELQAVAAARRLEELVAGEPAHVVVGGDFNATPDTSSMRFWTGRTSLDGLSIAYRDAWESVRGNESGPTFDPRNALTTIDEPGLDQGRRIDYLLVRCGDHGPTLRVADCRLALSEPVQGVQPSDHYGLVAHLVPRTVGMPDTSAAVRGPR
jgi:endonuclease/exonuclease/phosphatase family metal-dependent hydrolase